MAAFRRLSLVTLITLLQGCISLESFPCRSDAECVRLGNQGRCMLGSCAFPDQSCPVGLRWDPSAQSKAGDCLCSPDFSSDSLNCGGCGRICSRLSRGTSACVDGVCAITSCPVGYANCDGQYETGCEADLLSSDMQRSTDIDHCGACGVPCPLPWRATATACQSSVCRVAACAENYLDCDGQYSNGCECNGWCSGRSCIEPTCSDGVKDGRETDTDCGGNTTCPRCQQDQRCRYDSDCQTSYCNGANVCRPICESCGVYGCCGTYCRTKSMYNGEACFKNSDCQSCYCKQRASFLEGTCQ